MFYHELKQEKIILESIFLVYFSKKRRGEAQGEFNYRTTSYGNMKNILGEFTKGKLSGGPFSAANFTLKIHQSRFDYGSPWGWGTIPGDGGQFLTKELTKKR